MAPLVVETTMAPELAWAELMPVRAMLPVADMTTVPAPPLTEAPSAMVMVLPCSTTLPLPLLTSASAPRVSAWEPADSETPWAALSGPSTVRPPSVPLSTSWPVAADALPMRSRPWAGRR